MGKVWLFWGFSPKFLSPKFLKNLFPYDRKLAIKQGSLAIEFLLNDLDGDGQTKLDFSFGIIGTNRGYCINNIADIEAHANMKDRIPKHCWWMKEIREINVLLCNCREDDLVKKERIFSEGYAYSYKEKRKGSFAEELNGGTDD